MSDQRGTAGIAIAVIIGASLVGCTLILTRGVVRIKSAGDMIRVTGSARKQMRSDFIIWKGQMASVSPDVGAAYRSLRSGIEKTRQYLLSKGIAKEEIVEGAIQTRTLYPPTPKSEQATPERDVYRKATGYELSQQVEVRSKNVALVDDLSRKVTELLGAGIVFNSEPPEYIYTGLGELKVSMLADAAKDARNRAEQIAKNSGCRLGPLRHAYMSPLRITPAYAVVELDSVGTNDTTALDKDIVAVVSVAYAIR